jgi:hypothetical protein
MGHKFVQQFRIKQHHDVYSKFIKVHRIGDNCEELINTETITRIAPVQTARNGCEVCITFATGEKVNYHGSIGRFVLCMALWQTPEDCQDDT